MGLFKSLPCLLCSWWQQMPRQRRWCMPTPPVTCGLWGSWLTRCLLGELPTIHMFVLCHASMTALCPKSFVVTWLSLPASEWLPHHLVISNCNVSLPQPPTSSSKQSYLPTAQAPSVQTVLHAFHPEGVCAVETQPPFELDVVSTWRAGHCL